VEGARDGTRNSGGEIERGRAILLLRQPPPNRFTPVSRWTHTHTHTHRQTDRQADARVWSRDRCASIECPDNKTACAHAHDRLLRSVSGGRRERDEEGEAEDWFASGARSRAIIRGVQAGRGAAPSEFRIPRRKANQLISRSVRSRRECRRRDLVVAIGSRVRTAESSGERFRS